VIDFATGTGIVALAAAEHVGPQGSVLGIDIAPGLLAIARAKAAAAGIASVRFLERSIEAFEAPAGSFDVATCSFAIVLLEEVQPFLVRVRRLLTPDGFLAFTTNSEESYFHPQMLAAAAGAGITLPPIHGPLAFAAAIHRQLRQAGFGSCHITSLQLGTSLSLQEAQQRWDGRLWLHRHDPLAAVPEATVAAIKREFDRRLAAANREGRVWAEDRIDDVQAGLRDDLPGAILEGTSRGATMASQTVTAESAREAKAESVLLVRLFAGLREQAGWGERRVPLRPDEPAPTPAELWRRLALGPGPAGGGAKDTQELPPTIRVAVNQAFASPDAPLSPGDEVAFLPPTSGG
jgi:protein-L-isoaspartate(D-aspartate) O-methyltransferase